MTGSTALALLRDPNVAAALAFANTLRAGADLLPLERLPRAEGCRCPIETAAPHILDMRDTGAWLRYPLGRALVPAPDAVRHFVADFDRGAYPDLLPLPGVPCDARSHRARCPQSSFSLRAVA